MPDGFKTEVDKNGWRNRQIRDSQVSLIISQRVSSGVCVMRRSPSIASALPDDLDVYLVLDDSAAASAALGVRSTKNAPIGRRSSSI